MLEEPWRKFVGPIQCASRGNRTRIVSQPSTRQDASVSIAGSREPTADASVHQPWRPSLTASHSPRRGVAPSSALALSAYLDII